MGHQLTIESDEAFALATELASFRGDSLQAAVTKALRKQVEDERALAEKMKEVRKLTAEFRASLTGPLPTSDHSFLYETGLPI